MYPCFDESVTYGLAVTGLNISGTTYPTALETDGAVKEPNVRLGQQPSQLSARVTVRGLTRGSKYTVYRYDGTATLPAGPPFETSDYTHATSFIAHSETHSFDDPVMFSSDSAVYYIAVDSPELSQDHIATDIPSIPLGPGIPSLPLVSLGTGSGQHADVAAATKTWLQAGGRAIDTAYLYQDESDVADGIAQSQVPVGDIFITTKIMCGTYEKASKQIDDNLKQLRVDAVALTLIHFDKCYGVGSVSETWRALEDAKKSGKTKAIGLSNFGVEDLMKLKKTATLWPPALNQCSMSIGFHDDRTIAHCDEEKIVYMAYSPLCGGRNGSSCTHGSVMDIPEVKQVAAVHNVSTAQVALKWIVQQRRPLATAVGRVEYMHEDLDLWSWGDLSSAEMAKLSAVKSAA